jgi:predicted amidohydrolase YtcJ
MVRSPNELPGSRPYVGPSNDFGIQVMTEQELYENGRKAHEADWQIGVHANGDPAIDLVLRMYERLQRERSRHNPRFRLEHCTVINDSLVERIKTLGAIPTPFAAYVYYHGKNYANTVLNASITCSHCAVFLTQAFA